jgi:hypothetical protein
MHCVECPEEASSPVEVTPLDVGIAGGSAAREYERRMTKRQADARATWGDRFGELVLRLTVAPQSTRAWAAGAIGEERLAETLAAVEGIRVLNDRRVPRTRGNIDHVIVAPGGVFVVDAKRLQGRIEIRNRGRFFTSDYRLYVGRRDRSLLAEKLRWQIDAVQQALVSAEVDSLPLISAVLCFIDSQWPRFRPPDSYGGVLLEDQWSLCRRVSQPGNLDPGSVDRLARIIGEALPANRPRS